MKAYAQSSAARLVAGVTAVMMTLSAFASFATPAQAATDLDELCALAASLGISTPEFDALCAGDDVVVTTGESYYVHHPSIDFEFTRNLYIGSRGNDVMMLQKVLNLDADTRVAASGVGSAGMETQYFGELTRQAVAKFQAKHGISPAAGYFYPLTRAEMNKMVVGSGSDDDDDNDSDVEGDTLEVSEGDDIDNATVFAGQIHVPTTSVELEAGDDDVMIESITVEITGSARSDVDSVSVWHNGVILDTDSVDSDDEAVLDLDGFEVEEGEMEELTFSVTMESSIGKDGLTFQLEVVEIETDADVDGLPVDGARHEANDTPNQLNTYTIDIDTETGDLQVGDEEELIAIVNFDNNNTNSEDDSMYVQQFAIENTGDADVADDLDNIYVEVDGEEFDGEVMGDYIIFNFGDGIEIEEDDDLDFEIYADIVGGVDSDSGADIDFDLDADDRIDWVFVADEDDRLLVGTFATFSGDFEIEGGTGDSDDSDEVRDGNVTPGEEEAEMASFELDVEGENIVKGEITVNIAVSTTTPGVTDESDMELDNVTIIDEDGNVIVSEDENEITLDGAGADIVVTFEDVEFEEGDMTYIIIADINNDAPNGLTYTVGDIVFADFEGEESEEDVTISTITPGTVQTVQGPAIEIGVDSTLDRNTAQSNEDDVELAVILLDTTNSGEGVEVETISLNFTVTDNGAGSPTFADIDSCILFDEDGEEVSDRENVTKATAQDFDMVSNFVVEEDKVVALSLVCDLTDEFVNGDVINVEVNDTTSNQEVESTQSGTDVTITVDGVGTGDNDGEDITIADGDVSAQDGEETDWQSVRTGQLVYLGSVEIDSDEVEGVLETISFEIVGTDYLRSSKPFIVKNEDGDTVLEFFQTSDGDYDVTEDEWMEDVMIEDGITELFFWATTATAVDSEGQAVSVNIEGDTAMYIDGDSYTVSDTTLAGVKVYSGLAEFETEDVTSTDVNSDDVLMKFAITAVGEDIVLASTTATSVAVTGTATTGTIAIYYDNSGYDDAVDGTALSAADLTINAGETIYFVVKSATPVDEGDNNDKIRTTVDFDGAISVNGTDIDPVESDVDDFADNAESLIHTYTN